MPLCWRAVPLLLLVLAPVGTSAASFRVASSPPETMLALDQASPPPFVSMETVAREVAGLRSLMEANIARIDQALTALAKTTDKMPTEMDAKVTHLQQVITETVHRLELQTSVAQQSVRDALSSAEKARAEEKRLTTLAIDKAEKAAADERQDLADALTRGLSGLREQVQMLKERLDRFEGERSGVSGLWAVLLALLGVVGMVFGLLRARRPAVARRMSWRLVPLAGLLWLVCALGGLLVLIGAIWGWRRRRETEKPDL